MPQIGETRVGGVPRPPDEDHLLAAQDLLEDDPGQAKQIAERLIDAGGDRFRLAQAWQLLGSCQQRLDERGEAMTSFLRATQLYSEAGDTAAQARALLLAARVEYELEQHESSVARFDDAIALAQRIGDAELEAEGLNWQAGALNSQGKTAQALRKLEEALAIAESHQLEVQASLRSNIGILHLQLGDYPRALESLKAAYDLIRGTAPGTRKEAANLITLSSVYEEMRDAARAQELLVRAREVGRAVGDKLVEAASLNRLASIRCSLEEWQEAGELFRQALGLAREMGNRAFEIDNLDGLGQVHTALGQHSEAASLHLEAMSIARELGDREGENDALLNLGRSQLTAGETAEALTNLLEALGMAQQLERKRAQYQAHEQLARAYEAKGELAEALHHLREFYRIEKIVFSEENEERYRRLSVQFELDQTRRDAEAMRERTQLAHEAREAAEAMVKERTRELEEAQLEIVTRLAIAAEYRDDETGEHTWRVGRNAAEIARVLGWNEADVNLISAAARLHDVGKIGIRDSVLLKPDKLSDEEYESMRRHTLIGGRILSGGHSRLLQMAEEIAFAHHERWDGRGYPLGLAGEEIPLSARIVAVADVLDALCHARPYKRPWPVPEALAEIRRCSGRHFDPRVVDACIRIFGEGAKLSPTDDAPVRNGSRGGEALPSSLRARNRFEQVLSDRARELENARRDAESAARRMEAMAFSDSLTGLGNRRAFEVDLDAEVTRALRNGDSLAVLSIDLDDLKRVNDSKGHDHGDEMLRSFAARISKRLADLGRTYRVGGDEFGVIMAHVLGKDGDQALEELRHAIDSLRLEGFETLAASAGIAVLPDEASSVADLLRLSDQRMYRDKAQRKEAASQEA